MTRERPLRSSARRASRPEVMVPMRMLTMKMPPMVTISMSRRSCQPLSPATTPGIERAQHALPHALEEAVGMFVIGGVLADAHGREDQRGQHHDGRGQQRQPADDGDGALRKGVLEPVAQLVAPRDPEVWHGADI